MGDARAGPRRDRATASIMGDADGTRSWVDVGRDGDRVTISAVAEAGDERVVAETSVPRTATERLVSAAVDGGIGAAEGMARMQVADRGGRTTWPATFGTVTVRGGESKVRLRVVIRGESPRPYAVVVVDCEESLSDALREASEEGSA